MNTRRARNVVLAAAALLWVAVLLDCIGLGLRAEGVWRAGGMVAWLALAAALLGGVLLLIRRIGIVRSVVLLLGLALFALARWLRGSAGVPPDPPLLGAAISGAALYSAALLPRRARPN